MRTNVTETPAGKSWPDLGGWELVMEMDGEVRRESTDSWGVVIFADAPRDRLDSLVFTVSESQENE